MNNDKAYNPRPLLSSLFKGFFNITTKRKVMPKESHWVVDKILPESGCVFVYSRYGSEAAQALEATTILMADLALSLSRQDANQHKWLGQTVKHSNVLLIPHKHRTAIFNLSCATTHKELGGVAPNLHIKLDYSTFTELVNIAALTKPEVIILDSDSIRSDDDAYVSIGRGVLNAQGSGVFVEEGLDYILRDSELSRIHKEYVDGTYFGAQFYAAKILQKITGGLVILTAAYQSESDERVLPPMFDKTFRVEYSSEELDWINAGEGLLIDNDDLSARYSFFFTDAPDFEMDIEDENGELYTDSGDYGPVIN